MTVSARRQLAFASGCLIGIGLAWLTTSVLNLYITVSLAHPGGLNIEPAVPGDIWAACLAIGVGLGAAAAALIQRDPKPEPETRATGTSLSATPKK
jgi:multisubunit Na+/H+ antiporter MnhB subunit